MQIQLRKWDTGDWIEVIKDGKVWYQGHSVPDFKWVELLKEAGVLVLEEEEVDSLEEW